MLAKWRAFGVALALTLGVGIAGAQQSTIGGMPSRPRFNAIGVGTAPVRTTPEIRISGDTADFYMVESDAAANSRVWRMHANADQFRMLARTDDDSAGGDFLTVDRTGTTVDSINLQATAVQANGVPIATTETGTVAFTVTGFATPPNGTLTYHRAGDQVCLRIPNTSGTSNAASFIIDFASLPAALRAPVAVAASVEMGTKVTDSGTNEAGMIALNPLVNNTRLSVSRANGSAFTASGAKAVQAFLFCYLRI